MRAVEIPATGVSTVWPMVERWITAATDKTAGHWTASDVLAHCIDGRCTLWVVTDDTRGHAAIVTEIEDGPRQRIGRISILGGVGFRRWRHVITDLEAWARARGATAMQIVGRDEWQRVLAGDGYEKQAIVLGKSL